jgi:hypothetical protein
MKIGSAYALKECLLQNIAVVAFPVLNWKKVDEKFTFMKNSKQTLFF